MAGTTDGDEGNVEEASAKLEEGLKSCRSVIQNYRAILTEQSSDLSQSTEPPAPDSPPEQA